MCAQKLVGLALRFLFFITYSITIVDDSVNITDLVGGGELIPERLQNNKIRQIIGVVLGEKRPKFFFKT